MIRLMERAQGYPGRTALISNGREYGYEDLMSAAKIAASHLLNGDTDLEEAPIAFLVPPSFEYTAVQWGIWAAGGIAVPLCLLHPLPAIQYVVEDTGAKTVVVHPDFKELLMPLETSAGVALLDVFELLGGHPVPLPDIDPARRAMILYTSGTTSKPKGVVTTHATIESQIKALVTAWEWEENDHILNILPLHHVHGIINVMSCALWSGACCEFLPKFDANAVWEAIVSGRLTLFMAVPTVYFKLIEHWEQANDTQKAAMSAAAGKLRLMVSGSAALPVPVLEKWKAITGQTLLERYGMTEIGMGLSNPYKGERQPGFVGQPLPGVDIRIVDSEGRPITEDVTPGEIQVKGNSLFREYWGKEAATREAFTQDGWFKTGDIAERIKGSYRILGRDNIDIIKSGGYKISALEIEDVLRKHPDIKDCAVVGLSDEAWGEIVAAFIVSPKPLLNTKAITQWAKENLPAYKIPRHYEVIDELPRNVLGKVTKNALKKLGK